MIDNIWKKKLCGYQLSRRFLKTGRGQENEAMSTRLHIGAALGALAVKRLHNPIMRFNTRQWHATTLYVGTLMVTSSFLIMEFATPSSGIGSLRSPQKVDDINAAYFAYGAVLAGTTTTTSQPPPRWWRQWHTVQRCTRGVWHANFERPCKNEVACMKS